MSCFLDIYIFSRAKREAVQVACVRTLSSVYASLASCRDRRVKPLLPPVFPLLVSFSSQVLSQTISRLAWPPLSVSQLSEGKAGGDGSWGRRECGGGFKSALGELAVQPNEAESLFMELRIIFMIISTFSGSAAWKEPASLQALASSLSTTRLGAGHQEPPGPVRFLLYGTVALTLARRC